VQVGEAGLFFTYKIGYYTGAIRMNVQKDQIYLDKDGRRKGRTFRVEAVLNDGRVLVKPLSGGSKMTKISLKRFKPWKYELQSSGTKTGSVTPTPSNPLPPNFFSAAKSAGLTSNLPVTPTPVPTSTAGKSLADECQAVIPGSWKSDWPHVATLSQGCLGLVVRNFNNTSYDVKVKLDGLIVDTWSSQHLDLNTVLDHLRTKLSAMRDDFSATLN
jgi:hypothetical protein